MRSTKLVLRRMVAENNGKILFTSLIAASMPDSFEAVYGATKVFPRWFGEVLRDELTDTGVDVTALMPGVTDTDFFSRRGVPYDRRVPRPIPASRVAAAVVAALEQGRSRTVVPRWLAFPAWLSGAAPGTYRALARRMS